MNKKSALVLILCLVGVSVLAAGCTTQPVPGEHSTDLTVTTPTPPMNESTQKPVLDKDASSFDFIEITVHNITVQSRQQRSGRVVPLALFDISLRNDGVTESFSIDNTSLVLIAPGSFDQVYFYPETENLPEGSTNTVFPVNLSPGQEQRGTVVFQLIENVHSGVFYVTYPDWTIAGELYIPEISNGSLPDPDRYDPKTLGMRVNSAVQMKTIPGMNLRQGARIAIINVSITNYAGSDVTIQREQLFIQTERSRTLEHGGDRVTKEMARQYLRFPLVIRPGEKITGPVLYVIHSGTRTNKLVLMDNNCVIQSIVDLNTMYRYE